MNKQLESYRDSVLHPCNRTDNYCCNNSFKGHKPETTFWGIIVAIVSILLMWILIHYKVKIGKQFQSQALLADADCSKACVYLSIVLLVSSVAYEVTGIGGFDSVGAVGIALFSLKEGREAFEKAKGKSACSCQGKCSTGE